MSFVHICTESKLQLGNQLWHGFDDLSVMMRFAENVDSDDVGVLMKRCFMGWVSKSLQS